MRNPFVGLVWDRQKSMITAIVVLMFVCILLLATRGCNDQAPPQGTTPVPQGSGQPAPSAPQPAHTLVEDLEAIAGYFPGIQVNSATTPRSCVVKKDVLDDHSLADLQTGAKEELKRDGVKVKEVALQDLTIVLSDQGDRFTGFIARVTGTMEDGATPLAATDVYVGDGSWTPQRSAEFARNLRKEIESNPLYSLRAGGGGHRVRLELNVPHHRPVETND
ncbi:hypothetical protein COU79_05585 [Candidatus Peregrinibacteria bacterium CG10_big_fil_rev_8_21_14_0_10_54_7]|nr:MAG: hypothetical protein COU79_05585 [Candidatus Peregrinibacteria bacterium CG10_big_fil_rev_8_21_14_0_10_54_7]